MSLLSLLLFSLLGADISFGEPTDGFITKTPKIIIKTDPVTRNPKWVLEYMVRDQLIGSATRKNLFIEDHRVPDWAESSSEVYKFSGFDRGHLAAAGNYVSSQSENDYTFLMTNICPQTPTLNRDIWLSIENEVRALVSQPSTIEAWVITMPVYYSMDPDIYVRRIRGTTWVPTHMAKSILIRTSLGYTTRSWFVPNTGNPTGNFAITVDSLEGKCSMDLWGQLPDNIENEVEAR